MSSWFDQDVLQRRMTRRFPIWPQHDFLYLQAAEAVRDRLCDIRRDLPRVLEIGWCDYVVNDDFRVTKKVTTVDFCSPFSTENGILPVTPGHYDAVISHLVLPFADDPRLMLKQYFFALKPDGVFAGCTLGMESLHELRAVLAEAEGELYGGVSPRINPMVDIQTLAGLMQDSGFALPVVDYDRMTVTYETLQGLLADLRGLGQTNVLRHRRRQPLGKRFWERAEDIYRARFADERGRLVVTLDLIYLLGWSPDPSQPQPKARGSATVHLGDALKQ